jgi:hypothetical protein
MELIIKTISVHRSPAPKKLLKQRAAKLFPGLNRRMKAYFKVLKMEDGRRKL